MESLVHPMTGFSGKYPEKPNNPFRYYPAAAVRFAAEETVRHIRSCPELVSAFAEGKMLGVLVVADPEGRHGFLSAFSGNAGGKSVIPYFVPPVFDLADPGGGFRKGEAEISEITRKILEISHSEEYISAKERLGEVRSDARKALGEFRLKMAESKTRRQELRARGCDPETEAALIRESQFQKAELKRITRYWQGIEAEEERKAAVFGEEMETLKVRRQQKSDSLQKWIFRQYVVMNGRSEEKSIADIFAERGLVPPGGTGECAAPKLLDYAYRHGLVPVCMGEFWYGASPASELRQDGRFYPSCHAKCGPLLGYMLQGLEISPEDPETSVSGEELSDAGIQKRILYEDDWIVACDKPSGIPSVPGKDGRVSMTECMERIYGTGKVFPIHRLDMDTSGVLVFARDVKTFKALQKAFAEREVDKTYRALLTYDPRNPRHCSGSAGTISLPLIPDLNDRPRQKADRSLGKEAITEYRICAIKGKEMEVLFRPVTGRTHQLRVHAAHEEGLGSPIIGDLLYGGAPARQLQLRACRVCFIHPETGGKVEIRTQENR